MVSTIPNTSHQSTGFCPPLCSVTHNVIEHPTIPRSLHKKHILKVSPKSKRWIGCWDLQRPRPQLHDRDSTHQPKTPLRITIFWTALHAEIWTLRRFLAVLSKTRAQWVGCWPPEDGPAKQVLGMGTHRTCEDLPASKNLWFVPSNWDS